MGVRGKPTPYHWIYYPQRDLLFHRIVFFSNVSEKMAPTGHSSLGIEISYHFNMKTQREKILRKVINDMKKINIIRDKNDIVYTNTIYIKYGYIIYDKNRMYL